MAEREKVQQDAQVVEKGGDPDGAQGAVELVDALADKNGEYPRPGLGDRIREVKPIPERVGAPVACGSLDSPHEPERGPQENRDPQ